jgi:hypothetical protein
MVEQWVLVCEFGRPGSEQSVTAYGPYDDYHKAVADLEKMRRDDPDTPDTPSQRWITRLITPE